LGLRLPIRILEQFTAHRAGDPSGFAFVGPFVLAVFTRAGYRNAVAFGHDILILGYFSNRFLESPDPFSDMIVAFFCRIISLRMSHSIKLKWGIVVS
jgi:hypothetical protein